MHEALVIKHVIRFFPYLIASMPERVLIKYGGNAMRDESLKNEIAVAVAHLETKGFEVILVHGGGPFINAALEAANIASEFIGGQRYTSPEALEHIERTLKGQVNASLVAAFNRAGLRAVGLSGKDGQVVVAKQRLITDENGRQQTIGQVGDVVRVDPRLPELLLKSGFTPIFTCIASDEAHNDFNVNADMFAGHLAAALHVDQYIVLTDVDGLYERYPDPDSILRSLTLEELERGFGSIVQGGMIPKMESCAIALRKGAKQSVVLNGTKPEQLSAYLLDKESIGTTLTI